MRKTLWSLLIIFILIGLPPIRKSKKYMDIITDAEKVKIEQLVAEGILHRDNLQQFFDRFALAPNREKAIEHALDTGLRASVERQFQGIKNVFVEGTGLIKAHYQKHGILMGTWQVLGTVVLVPYHSWAEIFGGEPGLGDPARTLCGAATLFLIVLLILDWHFIWFYD